MTDGTPTSNYGWTKPTVGASVDQWGTEINADLDGIDSVVHGLQTSYLPLAGGTLTGALTPSPTAGIIGTNAANNVNAGGVGEFVTATQSTNVPLTSGTNASIVSISLTAGDWDIEGLLYFVFSVGGNGATASISPGGALGGGFSQLAMVGQTLLQPLIPTRPL